MGIYMIKRGRTIDAKRCNTIGRYDDGNIIHNNGLSVIPIKSDPLDRLFQRTQIHHFGITLTARVTS